MSEFGENTVNQVLAGAEPFRYDGDATAVLVLHGFTGTTQSVRYVSEELNRRFGFTILGPRLKGHGTSLDDMATTDYLDWLESAEGGLHELAKINGRVFIVGLSMGGTIALNLAARFPTIVAGVVPVNGPVGILEPAMIELLMNRLAPARIPGIGSDIKAPGVEELAYPEVPTVCLRHAVFLAATTGLLLHKITCPVLAIHSRDDHVVPPRNGLRIVEGIGSSDARLLWLSDSYHVATLDHDKDVIVDRAGRFIAECGPH